jgi:hypothetical protein
VSARKASHERNDAAVPGRTRLNFGTRGFIGALAAAVLGVAFTVGGYLGRGGTRPR